jgi:hypothetical protein
MPIGRVGFFREKTMSIDRIGQKGSPAAPSPTKTDVDQPGKAERSFEIERRTASPTQTPVPVDATQAALDRYRAGEIDLNGYLDLKVNEATAHLAALPAQALEAIRNALRDRLGSDPTLVELVHTATSHLPEPPGEP